MTESIFKKVKQMTRIEEVVAHYGIKLDRNSKALCPFHKEKTASFSVKSEDNRFHCFGCNTGGDAIDFVAKYEGIEPIEAAQKIAEMYKIETNKRTNKPSEETAKRALNKTLKPSIKEHITACISDIDKTDYFLKRGLTKETIARFGLGFNVKKQCVVIPYSSDYTYYQTRSIEGKEFRKPPTETAGPEPLYAEGNLQLKENQICFVVESPICAMSIMQTGNYRAIALCGTGHQKLLEAIKRQRPKGTLVLCLDNDDAGMTASNILLKELKKHKVHCVQKNIASRFNDPNECLIKDKSRFEQNLKETMEEVGTEFARVPTLCSTTYNKCNTAQ